VAGDYVTYLRRKTEALATEAAAQARFDKKLAGEETWVRQGIKARRTRNEGRVRALEAMREERSARRELLGTVRLDAAVAGAQAEASGRIVFELDHVSKSFGGTSPIVREFSARILRGDRIGLIGPNGAGKTTLLTMLLGELRPDQGKVRRGANVQIAYYDQQREQLDPDRTVFETVGGGNDTVTVNGRTRHVNALLSEFLFSRERARSPVRALSGGERNRLLMARLFTRPANVLILDEPTNDLDLETLELLEAQLQEWPGTLLLVSHDRVFLDNVVTRTFVFEGAGHVAQYVGGYEDWLRQRASSGESSVASVPARLKESSGNQPGATATAVSSRKLSYKEQRELEGLPARIETLEAEERALNERIAGADFYKEGGEAIAAALARLDAVGLELRAAYERWSELESRVR
jgi:ATP-binding cassette subfamily F protein uup